MNTEHPSGSVQAICSAAITMFSLLIAFIGYTGFNAKALNVAWRKSDLLYLILALIAVVALALVPWFATQAQTKDRLENSIANARKSFSVGAICTVLSIGVFVFIDYFFNHS